MKLINFLRKLFGGIAPDLSTSVDEQLNTECVKEEIKNEPEVCPCCKCNPCTCEVEEVPATAEGVPASEPVDITNNVMVTNDEQVSEAPKEIKKKHRGRPRKKQNKNKE